MSFPWVLLNAFGFPTAGASTEPLPARRRHQQNDPGKSRDGLQKCQRDHWLQTYLLFLLISHAQMFPKTYWCPHFSTSLCWMARVHSHIYIHVHVRGQAAQGLGGAVSPSPSLLAAVHSLCITGCMSRTEWRMNLLNSEYQSMRIWLYKHSDLKDVSDLSIFLQIPSNWCESNPEIWASHKQSAGTNNAAAAELTLWQSVSTSKLFICWEFV